MEREAFEQHSKRLLTVSTAAKGNVLMKAALLSIILLALCFSSVNAQTSTSASTSTSPAQEKVAAKTDGSATPSAVPAGLKIGKGRSISSSRKSKSVKITLFAKPPTIDGKLDDDVWQSAALLKDFYQIQPGDNLVPQNRTEVRIGYDPKFLYIAFHCYDDPS
jgi:hypothetical protein